ncbi:MAG: methyltransferase domain-containing protein [Acidimicrobiales bacterium]
MSQQGQWDPGQYERFATERAQPFHDLLGLVQPVPGGRVVDLGCGTGELTQLLHQRSGAEATVGIDTSSSMLDKAAAHAGGGLTFGPGDLRDPPGDRPFDVVFSNAALQWVPEHPTVLATWASWLSPRGQLAVQVPANVDHPSHTVSAQLASEEPFRSALGGSPVPDPVLSVLTPQEYAQILFDLGFGEQTVRLQVYGHVMDSTRDVVEWVKGTSLTRFKVVMPDDVFAEFLVEYERRLIDELGDRSPFFYGFKRVLMWARR